MSYCTCEACIERARNDDIERLRAENAELRAHLDQDAKVDAAVDVLQGATLEVLRKELEEAKAALRMAEEHNALLLKERDEARAEVERLQKLLHVCAGSLELALSDLGDEDEPEMVDLIEECRGAAGNFWKAPTNG